MSNSVVEYVTAEELLENAEYCSVCASVTKEYAEKHFNLIDQNFLLEQEAWSTLSSKIVGAEGSSLRDFQDKVEP
jgi:hypothetical protein